VTYRERERLRKLTIVSKRRKRDTTDANIFWLTIVKKKTTCCKCTSPLLKNTKMVYLPKRKECICMVCAENESLKYSLSFLYEKQTRKGKKEEKQN
jgi:hypothetical protein